MEGDVGSRAYNPAGVENEGGKEGDHDQSIDHHKEEGRGADAENAPAPVGMAAVLVHLPAQKNKKVKKFVLLTEVIRPVCNAPA